MKGIFHSIIVSYRFLKSINKLIWSQLKSVYKVIISIFSLILLVISFYILFSIDSIIVFPIYTTKPKYSYIHILFFLLSQNNNPQ